MKNGDPATAFKPMEPSDCVGLLAMLFGRSEFVQENFNQDDEQRKIHRKADLHSTVDGIATTVIYRDKLYHLEIRPIYEERSDK